MSSVVKKDLFHMPKDVVYDLACLAHLMQDNMKWEEKMGCR